MRKSLINPLAGRLKSNFSKLEKKIASSIQFSLLGAAVGCFGASVFSTLPSYATSNVPDNRLETFALDVTKNRIDFATLKDVEPRGQVILNPARIVIDLPGAIYRGKTVRRTIGRSVQAVRVGQVDAETTRLVVEFPPEMEIDAQNLRLKANTARSWSIQLPENVATSTLSATMFAWPLIGTLTAGFGWRIHPITGVRKMHKGIDIAAPTGAPILAAADGVVLDAEFDSDYGNFVELSHSDGSKTMYAHANRLLVSKGMMVKKGQAIAEVGTTGRSTGPHLHFEFLADGKQPTDPMAMLPQRYLLFDVAAR